MLKRRKTTPLFQRPLILLHMELPFDIADPVCTSVQPNYRTNCGSAGIDEHACGERGCCFDWQRYAAQTHMCFFPASKLIRDLIMQIK